MKAVIIIAAVGAIIFVVVSVLGSTLGDPEYENQDTGVTGPLARGAVSRALHDVNVWRLPRDTHSRKDRREMLVGVLREGDVFRVTKNYRKGSLLWVEIQARDDPSLRGWLRSPPDDPVQAEKYEEE